MPKTDREIIARVLAGEPKAFAELVNRHKDRAMTLAMRMLRNREEAEEAVQDAFVRAFRALSGFESRSSFSTWFYRIVYNVCSTALERRDGGHRISIDEESDASREVPALDPAPDTAFESLEFEKGVHEAIAALPPAYGGVLTLFVLQEMSYDEIVEVTGLPIGTVKAKLFRARALLRQALVRKFSEAENRLASVIS